MTDNTGDGGRPLGHRQRMILAGQALDPDIPMYNMAHAFTVEADLDVEAFRDAFDALVDGVDALRTVVTVGGDRSDGPSQQVLPSLGWSLPFVDLTQSADPERELAGWLTARAKRQFDLGEQLFDSALLRTGEHRYVWYLNQHHLVTDAWSMSLLLRRQSELYQLALDGRLDQAEPLPPYADFLEAEAKLLGSDGYQRSLDHWQNKLGEPPEPLTFYGNRPADLGAETVRVSARIEGRRAERLAAFLASPEMAGLSPELTALRFFHTVLFAYLHRVCGCDELVVGTPFHNRSKRKAKETVGLFMNLYPVMATIEEGQTMLELSNALGAEVFESMQHARFPMGAADENGAFEVVLNYLHIPYETFGEQQVDDQWIHPGAGDRTHSLRLQIRRNDGPGFRLFFDVKSALFDERARSLLVDHFLRMLDGWLDDANAPVDGVSLLSDTEEQQLVAAFNSPSGPSVPTTTVVEDFESLVAQNPQALAVTSDLAAGPDQSLSYEELNVSANRVANNLLARGIGTGDYVGVLLPRGPEAIIAILGVLKAGAAYVPMEPDTPAARLSQIIADTTASVVCTDTSGASTVEGSGAAALLVADVAATGGLVDHNPAVTRSAEHPAYAIFTSGSTGRPKGVPVNHRGLNNYITWARRHYTGGDPRVFALFTSLAFDLTVTSIFVPLTSGGSMVTYPDDVDDGTPAVVRVWRDDRVDVAKATPSHLTIIRQLGLSAGRLKVAVVGGEDLTTDLAGAIQDLHPGLAIYNEYGPTETVVGCMIHRFDPSQDLFPSVPIGVPAANAKIFLLDEHLNPVPPGVIGEIYIGGPGVAGQYLKQPDITAERFITNPFDPSTLIYRSGDLGRWRPEPVGAEYHRPQLEFLGRADDQVKVRGHRIELGEIESALAATPQIQNAAVTVVTETIGSTFVRPEVIEHCVRCGLPSNFPEATFDNGVCSLCQDYDTYRTQVDAYFRDLDELKVMAEQIRADVPDSQYDCVVLLSGGKDSTYMLYQVVALGLKPLVFTLDNGFISPSAIANCRRVCEHLGVDLEIGSTEHMNEIFRDSLERFSNVCHGCFKTIYTLSMNLARKHGLGYIVTGLARGQLFETRLSDMYNHRIFDVEKIDQFVLDARKAYHHIDDAVSQNLDVRAFEDDKIFEEVQFVDFYRYADVALGEVLSFLEDQTPWARPPDTGRSTNCLINDVGIHVHNRERGFHNYALPYSWDVRLGHKEREAALDELDDDIDTDFVNEVLVEIGYKPKPPPEERETSRLVAHYQAPVALPDAELRSRLSQALPEYMIPTSFVHHELLPLTTNGKVDRAALLAAGTTARSVGQTMELGPEEERSAAILCAIWEDIFNRSVQVDDNFFELGGDSISAIQIVHRAASEGVGLTPRQLFEAQTPAAAAIVADLLVPDELVEEQAGDTAPGPSEKRDRYPLTPTQSGMLFHSLAEPDSGLYEGQIVHHLRGKLDLPLFDRCWHDLVTRHDVMRTVFRWQGEDEVNQVVADQVWPGPSHHDLSSNDDPAAALEHLLAEDRAKGFDLSASSPVRVALVQLPSHPVLVWSFHHIAFDGWSIALAMHELLDSYNGAVGSQPWSAPPRRPFSGYIDWLADRDQNQAETFWRQQLSSFTAATSLPRSSGLRPELPSGERTPRPYAAAQRAMNQQASQALLQFAGQERVTLSTVLQAAWGLTLARYEGSDDVVFGVTTSGRPATLPGAETMIGMMVTTLPARVKLAGDLSPGDWLRQIQAGQLGVRDHEYAALVDIQGWSSLPAGQSLFDSILVVENFPDYQAPEDPTALTIDSRAYRVQSNYPLSLIVLPGPELTFKAVYDPTQFSSDRITEILDHVEAAVSSLTAGSAGTVDELSLVPVAEAADLGTWSVGAPLQAEPALLPDLIRQRAAEQPDAVAAVCGEDRLTYGELLAKASVLADGLRDHGVAPNTFVGVKLERSIEMVIAIVGVLEAGAAYLPLDPSYPVSRLEFMLADADVSIMVTPAGPEPAVGESGLAIETLDETSGTAADKQPVSADDLAYLIYTSGSTGQPNGVPITHGNLAYSTAARAAYYHNQPASFLLLSSFSFDSSIVGIFWTLASGGRLVLPGPGEELDMRILSGLIGQQAVTHMLALPSLYRLLLDFADPETLRSLDTIIVAGEACPRDLVDRHHSVLPATQLHNEYGPTEASVWCSVHQCVPEEQGPVSIGRAIPGATVAVLDRTGRPAGIGVPGEIHVAGPGLAAGYHNRPELTAERFVEIDGRRWFGTRDQGSVNKAGLIEFGGRADNQVKIRGHRVELGEVEAVINSHRSVASAAAAVADNDPSTARLVAYVELERETVAASSTDLQAEIRALVSARLPEPFVPSVIITVDSLPRLPNGKIDRSTLPEITPADAARPTRQASTGHERAIASIWSELLPGVSFGVDDDFFEVGGHSLLAVALVEKIRRLTGAELPISALLDTPTIAALAARVSDPVDFNGPGADAAGSNTAGKWRCLVPMRTTGNRVPLYLVPPAAGTALSFRTLVADSDPDQPLYCFEPIGTDGKEEPQDTVEAMAATYVEELKAAQPDGRYRIGGSCLGAIVAWEMAQQLQAEATPVELLVFLDPGPPHSGPGWSYSLPSQRSPLEFVRSALDIVKSGELLTTVQAVWRRNAFERIGRIHYRAQLSYVSDRLRVPILWLQSAELAAKKPEFLEQWRILAGDDLTPIVVPDTTHDGLMRGEQDEAARLTVLFNDAMSVYAQAVLEQTEDQLPSGSGGESHSPAT